MNNHPRGIIFDLDGTLADTLEDIVDGVNYAMQQYGRPSLSLEQVRNFVGSGILTLMGRAAGCEDDEADCKALVEHFRTWYHAHMLDKTHLYPGISVLLDQLSELSIPMSILSNKPHVLTREIADALLSKWSFVEVRGDSDAFPRKPDPASALHLADRMGTLPKHTIFIGDSEVDVETALAAGMKFIGVDWGFRDASQLHDAGTDTIVRSTTELLKHINV